MGNTQSEHWLKRHVEGVLFALGLALIVFTVVPFNIFVVARSEDFYDWADDHAPLWLAMLFGGRGTDLWVNNLKDVAFLYCFLPSVLIVSPCLSIAMLVLRRKACSWGKIAARDPEYAARLGARVTFFVRLVWAFWLVSVFWLACYLFWPSRAVEKPVIYLYPQTEQRVIVKLRYPGTLLHTYPEYSSDGWNVIARPSGEMVDLKTGRKYYCLFWEGQEAQRYDLSTGFVVEGQNTAQFLEESLATLGLSDREADEFIIYWLPRMERNRFNVIHFATAEYSKHVPLDVTPAPDTVIRVLMVFRACDSRAEIEPQVLPPVTRCGFTVVEWGGTELK
ncbi:MAG: hypothetical protein ABSA67_00675 [Candidatus Brocadiia bacterium]|jgi:hypothetical protein